MRAVYKSLDQRIHEAGFHTIASGKESDRLICASKRFKHGLTGNSFWIAERDGRWYVGTWAPYVYEFPDAERVAEFCVTWLSHTDETCGDIEEAVKHKFQLAEVDDEFADREFIFDQGHTDGGEAVWPSNGN